MDKETNTMKTEKEIRIQQILDSISSQYKSNSGAYIIVEKALKKLNLYQIDALFVMLTNTPTTKYK